MARPRPGRDTSAAGGSARPVGLARGMNAGLRGLGFVPPPAIYRLRHSASRTPSPHKQMTPKDEHIWVLRGAGIPPRGPRAWQRLCRGAPRASRWSGARGAPGAEEDPAPSQDREQAARNAKVSWSPSHFSEIRKKGRKRGGCFQDNTDSYVPAGFRNTICHADSHTPGTQGRGDEG